MNAKKKKRKPSQSKKKAKKKLRRESRFHRISSFNKKDVKENLSMSFNQVSTNDDYVALYWNGQNPRVDLISLNSLQVKLNLLGNWTKIGLSKSFLILYEDKELAYIDIAIKWWEKIQLQYDSSLRLTRII